MSQNHYWMRACVAVGMVAVTVVGFAQDDNPGFFEKIINQCQPKMVKVYGRLPEEWRDLRPAFLSPTKAIF